MKLTFRDSKGEFYEVPENEVEQFRSVVADAQQVQPFFDKKGEMFAVPFDEIEEFQKVVPDAMPSSTIKKPGLMGSGFWEQTVQRAYSAPINWMGTQIRSPYLTYLATGNAVDVINKGMEWTKQLKDYEKDVFADGVWMTDGEYKQAVDAISPLGKEPMMGMGISAESSYAAAQQKFAEQMEPLDKRRFFERYAEQAYQESMMADHNFELTRDATKWPVTPSQVLERSQFMENLDANRDKVQAIVEKQKEKAEAFVDTLTFERTKWVQEYSRGIKHNTVAKAILGAVDNLPQMAVAAAGQFLNKALPGVGGATAYGLMSASEASEFMDQAAAIGLPADFAIPYAMEAGGISGAVEYSEQLINIALLGQGGKIAEKAGEKIFEKILKKTGSVIAAKVGTKLAMMVPGAVGEGGEEVTQGLIQFAYLASAVKDYSEKWGMEFKLPDAADLPFDESGKLDVKQAIGMLGEEFELGAGVAVVYGLVGLSGGLIKDQLQQRFSKKGYNSSVDNLQMLEAFAVHDPQTAQDIANKENPSRRDFVRAGLPDMPAKARAELAKDLREVFMLDTDEGLARYQKMHEVLNKAEEAVDKVEKEAKKQGKKPDSKKVEDVVKEVIREGLKDEEIVKPNTPTVTIEPGVKPEVEPEPTPEVKPEPVKEPETKPAEPEVKPIPKAEDLASISDEDFDAMMDQAAAELKAEQEQFKKPEPLDTPPPPPPKDKSKGKLPPIKERREAAQLRADSVVSTLEAIAVDFDGHYDRKDWQQISDTIDGLEAMNRRLGGWEKLSHDELKQNDEILTRLEERADAMYAAAENASVDAAPVVHETESNPQPELVKQTASDWDSLKPVDKNRQAQEIIERPVSGPNEDTVKFELPEIGTLTIKNRRDESERTKKAVAGLYTPVGKPKGDVGTQSKQAAETILSPFTSKDETRPVLQVVAHNEDAAEVVATNGKMLGVVLGVDGKAPIEGVAAKSSIEVVKPDGNMGDYPNYGHVIPQYVPGKMPHVDNVDVVIDYNPVEPVLNRVNSTAKLFRDQKEVPVAKLYVAPDGSLDFNTATYEDKKSIVSVESDKRNKVFVGAFDANYLRDTLEFLYNAGNKSFRVNMTQGNRGPALFLGDQGNSYAVLMPLRMDGEAATTPDSIKSKLDEIRQKQEKAAAPEPAPEGNIREPRTGRTETIPATPKKEKSKGKLPPIAERRHYIFQRRNAVDLYLDTISDYIGHYDVNEWHDLDNAATNNRSHISKLGGWDRIPKQNIDELTSSYDQLFSRVSDMLDAAERSYAREQEQLARQSRQQVPTAILESAAKHGVKGIGAAAEGLYQLFGAGKHMGTGVSFDADTYAKAKPHFQQAYKEFVAAGHDVMAFIKWAMSSFGDGIRPYLKQFKNDLAQQGQMRDNNSDGGVSHENNATDSTADQGGGEQGALLVPGSGRPGTGADAAVVGGVAPQDAGGTQGARGGEAASAVAGGEIGRGIGLQHNSDENATDGRTGAGREGVVPDRGGRADDTRGGDRGSALAADKNRAQGEAATNDGRSNYRITNPEALVGGGPKVKFARNQQALETYMAVKDSGRAPTAAELDAIASYIGWGSFGQELFQGTWDKPRVKNGWEKENSWLRDHLGKEAWESAQRSIINAHYTNPPTVQAMWDMVRRLGFKGGKVLEPSVGIGNFFGMMPADLAAKSDLTGIELDEVTGGMAQLLYPQANIQIKGYQDSRTPDGFYDLVIGNWPFSEVGPADRRYNKLGPTLHDYFFLKALDQVRPGGLVVGITSSGTMDKLGQTTRLELAKNADLVASFRLPMGAFKQYAGTDVVTDIIILRKHEEGTGLQPVPSWVQTEDVTVRGGKVRLNKHYVENPDHILGKLGFGHGTTWQRPGMIVEMTGDVEKLLTQAIESLPKNVMQPRVTKTERYVTNNSQDRVNSVMVAENGDLLISLGEQAVMLEDRVKIAVKSARETEARRQQIRDLVGIRKSLGQLIDQQRDGSPNTEATRQQLRDAYRKFVKEYGRINDSYAIKRLKTIGDPNYASLAGLERNTAPTGETPVYEEAAIITRPTTRTKPRPENLNVADAYMFQRNEYLDFDAARVAELAKVDEAQVIKELLDAGVIFKTPAGVYEHSDVYLSGNVRIKLLEAQNAKAEGIEGMDSNIAALEKVMPETVPYYKIEAKLGNNWTPVDVYKQFIAEMLGVSSEQDMKGIDLQFSPAGWKVRLSPNLERRPEASSNFGSSDINFGKLIEHGMKNTPAKILAKDSEGNVFVDEKATAQVNEKIAAVKDHFSDWIWKDAERRVDLEKIYNEINNSIAKSSFNGDFLTFEGMALEFGENPLDLRKHQRDAIARGLILRRSLYAHEVGTGKTFTMAGIAIESRRYGLAKKPLLFGHNANSATVAAEFGMMYPGAKILYVDNLSKETRDITLAQIVNDDWDCIIVPHSMIDKFALHPDTYAALAAQEIAELEAAALEAAAEDNVELNVEMMDDPEAMKRVRSPSAKQMVKAREQILERINKMSQKAAEDAISLEDAGIDMILVDEAHEFKKPPIATSMQMKGLNKQTSARSINMMFLLQYIAGINNGKGVHLFTGTPITNTLNEMYNMMRYIMPNEMKDTGVSHWDAWFNSFAAEQTDIEVTPAGDYQPVSRLSSFVNVSDLRQQVGQFMDTVFAEDMPEFKDRTTADGKTLQSENLTAEDRDHLLNGRTEKPEGRPYKVVRTVVAEMTEGQRGIRTFLQQQAQRFRSMNKKERREAMLSGDPSAPLLVEGAAAKAGLDARLYQTSLPDDPNSKVNKAVSNVLEHYAEHPLATQVIFMEQGFSDFVSRSEKIRDETGKVTSERKYKEPTFNVAKDIVGKLVKNGIPTDQIAVVDGTTSKQKRKEIADAMNEGTIRVVIGSTGTLGTGVNMQNNLRAMHHLDAPWMPGELEQRNGRGHRQGNKWNSVIEYRYVTEGIDGRRWQVLVIKSKFIQDFLRGKKGQRVIEGDVADMDDGGSGNDMLATLSEATGDPRILQIEKARRDVERLQRRERLFTEGKIETERTIRRTKERTAWLEREVAYREAVNTVYEANKDASFSIEIEGKTYNQRKDADAAIEKIRDTWGKHAKKIGSYKGLDLFGLHNVWSGLIDGKQTTQHDYALEARHPTEQKVDLWNPIESRGTIAGLDAVLRNNQKHIADTHTAISEAGKSIERLTASLGDTFGQQEQLDRTIARLEMLNEDLRINAVPPPAWLRQGAPVGSTVVYEGQERVVAGHKWSNEGWFVMLEPVEGSTETTPQDVFYMDVNDEQGVAVYEEHQFEPPVVVTPSGNEVQNYASRPKTRDTHSTVTAKQDAEYLAAVKRGDMATAKRMAEQAATASGLAILDDSASTAYRVRRTEPPKNTVKAYKLFATKPKRPGQLFPLFVGATEAVPQGVWLDAISGPEANTKSKKGRKRVKSKLGDLAYRPGWHAGDIPLATHIGVKDAEGNIYARRKTEVWAEVEMAADVEYQQKANASETKDLQEMPVDGQYRFKTNPNMTGEWIISGSMKVNRVLTQAEVDAILTKGGHETMPWDGGDLVLENLGLTPEQAINKFKLADAVTYDSNGEPIPLSQRYNPDSSDILHYAGGHDDARPERKIKGRRQDGAEVKAKATAATAVVDTIRKLYPGLSVRARATWTMKKNPGWYNSLLGEIRLRNAGDVIVAVHELGHHFDRELDKWSNKPGHKKEIPGELIKLGKELYGKEIPRGGYRSEGFAEFIGRYLIGDEIQKKAPNLYEWFTTEYLPANPKEAAKLRTLETVVAQFQLQTPEQAIKAFMSPRRQDWSGQRIAAQMAGIESQWIDSLMPLLRGMQETGANVMNVGDGPGQIPANKHPFMLATYFARTAGGRTVSTMLRNSVDLYGQPNGKSARDVLMPAIESGKVTEFFEYAVAQRVAERYYRRGLEAGLAMRDALDIINKHKSPQFDQMLEEFTDLAHRTLHLLVESGDMTQAEFATIVEDNPIYIPLMRQFLPGEKREGRTGSKGRGIHRVRGGTQPIVNPLTAFAMQVERVQKRAMQTAVLKSLVEFYDTHQARKDTKFLGQFMSEVPLPKDVVHFPLEQIKQHVADLMIDKGPQNEDYYEGVWDAIQERWNEWTKVFVPSKSYKGTDNIVILEIGGVRRAFEVRPDLLPIIEGVTNSSFKASKIAAMMRGATNLQRLGATGLNPAFGLIRNLLRDAGTAAVLADYHFHVPVLSTLQGMVMDIANTDTANLYHSAGLDSSGFYGQQRAAKRLGQRATAKTKVGQAVAAGPIDALMDVLGRTEVGPRLMEFRGAYKYAKAQGWSDSSAMVWAGVASKDVTVNFSRAGSTGRQVNEAVLFANANIQSADKLARALGARQAMPWSRIRNTEGTAGGELNARLKSAGRTTARALAWITIGALMAYLRNRDDEWWKELPPYEKWNYVHIDCNLSDEEWRFDNVIRWPLPFEIGALYGAAPIALLEESRAPGSFKEAVKVAIENQMPFDFGVTEDDFRHGVAAVARNISLISPIIDILINEDWKGSAIIPRHQEHLLSELQFKHDTSWPSKWIGEHIGMSPTQVEHVLNGYTGNLYKRTLDAAKIAIGKGDIDLADKSTLPIIGTLFMKPNTSRLVNDFYTRFDELEKRVGSDQADADEAAELKAMRKINAQLQKRWRARRNALSEGGIVGKRAAEDAVLEIHDLIRYHNKRWEK